MGCLKRAYDDGLDEATIENHDETHMILDMDNEIVLDFSGTKRVSYNDVSNGRNCFTICFRISEGPERKIENLFVIFQNPYSIFSILGLPGNAN